jgi:hypothetical protein
MEQIQTVELTSKRWKLYQVLGGGAVGVGILVMINFDGDAAAFLAVALWFLGVSAYVIGRIGAWWYNR